MRYSNKGAGKRNLKSSLVKIFCAATLLVAAAACTEVDDRLGSDLLPENQSMNVKVFSLREGIDTYLYRADSIPSSRLGLGVFGRMTDRKGVFGAQSNSMLLQFVPYTLPYSSIEGYGIDPIIDSMRIVLSLSDVRGDTTRMQTFDVYDVVAGPARLTRDSVYYNNFQIEPYRGEKLFSFSHTGRRSVTARLFPTAAGKKYLDSIIHLGWDDYTSDTLFLKKFHGLYITPAEDSDPDAAVYSAALASSGLQLFVRNHDTTDVSAIYDTVSTLFMFTDNDVQNSSTGATVKWNNVSINMARFDYTGSTLGGLETSTNGFTDTLPESTPLDRVYVQTMGGVGTMLRFTDQFVEQMQGLRERALAEGEQGGRDVMINQAMMRIWIDDPSIDGMDASLERLGSYTSMSNLYPVPDYQYIAEAYQQKSDATYRLPYNGYLNRSNGYYELDITAYVQRLAKKDGDRSYRNIRKSILLGPQAYGTFGFGTSSLLGSGSDKPVSIRITYTVIK